MGALGSFFALLDFVGSFSFFDLEEVSFEAVERDLDVFSLGSFGMVEGCYPEEVELVGSSGEMKDGRG